MKVKTKRFANLLNLQCLGREQYKTMSNAHGKKFCFEFFNEFVLMKIWLDALWVIKI